MKTGNEEYTVVDSDDPSKHGQKLTESEVNALKSAAQKEESVVTTTEPLAAITTEPLAATTTEPLAAITTEPLAATTTEPPVVTAAAAITSSNGGNNKTVDLTGFKLNSKMGGYNYSVDKRNEDGTYTITRGTGTNAETITVTEEELYSLVNDKQLSITKEGYEDLSQYHDEATGKVTPESVLKQVTKVEQDKASAGEQFTSSIIETNEGQPATADSEKQQDSAIQNANQQEGTSTGQNNKQEADSVSLTETDKEQLDKDVMIYKQKHPGTDDATAREECKKELTKKKEAEKKTKKESFITGEMKQRIDKCVEKKVFVDEKLKGVSDILLASGKDSTKKVQKFKDYLTTKIQKSPLLQIDLTSMKGESAEAYKRIIEDLKAKTNIVIENATKAEIAAKLVEELVELLTELLKVEKERETKRQELEKMIADYNTFAASPPEETIAETYIDNSTDPAIERVVTVTNPAYTSWLEAKAAKEAAIEALTKEVEELDKKGEELKEKCYTILGKETDLEALLKDFEKSLQSGSGGKKRNPTGGDEGSDNPGGEDNPYGGDEPKTEPPVELPDNTQDQLKYYKELTMAELSDISANLSKFAETNNLTLEQLLLDENCAEILIKYIESSPVFSDALKKLIVEGNPKASQTLLRQIFTGQQTDVMGLNEISKESVKALLRNIANENNISADDLLSKKENVSKIREGLKGYKDIVGNLKSIKTESIREKLVSIYDGEGIGNYSTGSIVIMRNYTDIASGTYKLDVDEYLASEKAATDFASYGKTAVLMDTISGFTDDNLIEALKLIIK